MLNVQRELPLLLIDTIDSKIGFSLEQSVVSRHNDRRRRIRQQVTSMIAHNLK